MNFSHNNSLKRSAFRFFFYFSIFLFFYCPLLSSIVPVVSAQSIDQATQRAEWEAELQSTEADIVKWQGILDTSKKNTASLQNDAAVLTAKINQAKAFIKQKNIAIAKLDVNIADKNKAISSLEDKIQNS